MMRWVFGLGFGLLAVAATSCDRTAFVSLVGASRANAHVDAVRFPLRVGFEVALEEAE